MNVDNEAKRKRLEGDRLRIERTQQKLLEAHYDDFIPAELLRKEQKWLERELTTVNRSLSAQSQTSYDTDRLVTLALDLCENLAASYEAALSHIRRTFNQVIFERIDVHFDANEFRPRGRGRIH